MQPAAGIQQVLPRHGLAVLATEVAWAERLLTSERTRMRRAALLSEDGCICPLRCRSRSECAEAERLCVQLIDVSLLVATQVRRSLRISGPAECLSRYVTKGN